MEPRKCGKGNPARAYCSVAGRECRHTLDKSRAARSMTRSGRALAKICSCKTVLCYYLSAVSPQRRELITAPFLSHFSKNNGNIPREVQLSERVSYEIVSYGLRGQQRFGDQGQIIWTTGTSLLQRGGEPPSRQTIIG